MTRRGQVRSKRFLETVDTRYVAVAVQPRFEGRRVLQIAIARALWRVAMGVSNVKTDQTPFSSSLRLHARNEVRKNAARDERC